MSKNKTLFIGFFMGIVFTFAILYLSGFVPKTGKYELVALRNDNYNNNIYEIIYNTETGQVVSREASRSGGQLNRFKLRSRDDDED